MKIVKNEKLITRNGKIGQWTSLAALAVLGVGMYISFTRVDLFIYSVACLLVGFILTQVGMYMGSRWGRSPRPDEKLDAGLKGLHSDFNLYHYASPVSHLLIGPAGIWVLLPHHQSGKVEYVKKRWRLSGGGFMQAYMKIFGQENLGRPDLEAETETQTLKKFLAAKLSEAEIPTIQAALVFTDENVEVEPNDSPIPAMKLKQLKEFLREKAKSKALTAAQIEKITTALA
ncbi:MAG: hypothetical protein Fur002_25320 [Anaerolineales bacterium]